LDAVASCNPLHPTMIPISRTPANVEWQFARKRSSATLVGVAKRRLIIRMGPTRSQKLSKGWKFLRNFSSIYFKANNN